MITCTDKAANYFQKPESMHDFLYKHYLFTQFCGGYDKDRSGGLSYDEFRFSFGIFAIHIRFGMAAYDYNQNGLIDQDEAEALNEFFARVAPKFNWEISDEQLACLENAKYNAKDIF